MKVFELKEMTGELTFDEMARLNGEVVPTDLLNNNNPYSHKKFKTREEGLEELEKYENHITMYNENNLAVFNVFFLEEYEADKDGEFVEGSDYHFLDVPQPESERYKDFKQAFDIKLRKREEWIRDHL